VKLFKAVTTVSGPVKEPFVDWYEGETLAQACVYWEEDCHRYGTPLEACAVTFTLASQSERELWEEDRHDGRDKLTFDVVSIGGIGHLPQSLQAALRSIWSLDKNGFCILTDHSFTALEAHDCLAALKHQAEQDGAL
jgi:hypothetical protein